MTNNATESVAQSYNQVKYTFQGTLVEVTRKRPIYVPRKVAKVSRGLVNEFSRKSRIRLMKMFNRVDWTQNNASFLTLTYGEKYPGAKTAKLHLRSFIKRVLRSKFFKDKKCSIVWRLEFQERGAPHFHLLITNCPYIPFKLIAEMWSNVVHKWSGKWQYLHIKINFVKHNKRRVMKYVSKYVAKRSGSSKFTPMPYPPVEEKSSKDSEPDSVGRWWGVENEQFFPYAPLETIVCDMSEGIHNTFKRYARRKYERVNNRKYDGFFIFVTSVDRWRELLEFSLFHGRKQIDIATGEVTFI